MCTGVRFTDDAGNLYFGRNLDWSFSYGEKTVITPRGYERPYAFLPHKTGHALIGSAIVVDNTPLYFDGGNEAGLAIGGLIFTGFGKFEPGPVEGKTNLAAYEFPLWVLSEFETVDQVEEAMANVAIIDKPINDQYPVSYLHWLIGDSKRSIVVEYMADGLHLYHDDVDVLTNQPTFAFHRENLNNYLGVTPTMPAPVKWRDAELAPYGSGAGMRGLPGDFFSPSRFVRAAYFNSHYPAQTGEAANVARLFHTLGGSAMIDGAAIMADGKFEKTVYTGGYSSATKSYYHSTYENPAITSITMNDYDLDTQELIVKEHTA